MIRTSVCICLLMLAVEGRAQDAGVDPGFVPNPVSLEKIWSTVAGLTEGHDLDSSLGYVSSRPGSLECLCAILWGVRPPSAKSDETLTPRGRELVLAAISRVKIDRLHALLERIGGRKDPLRDKLRAIELMREVGTAESVRTFIKLVARFSSSHRKSAQVQGAYRNALTAILSRDPGAKAALKRSWDKVRGSIFRATVAAIVDADIPLEFEFLASFLSGKEKPDQLILDNMAKQATSTRIKLSPDTLEIVRKHFDSESLALRRESARVLGMLHDIDSFHRLADGLDDDDPRFRSVCLWSLRKMSGQQFPEVASCWRNWYQVELNWLEATWPGLSERFAQGDADQIIDGIRSILDKRLFRHTIAGSLEELLMHDETRVRQMSCVALGQLGSCAALTHLVYMLEDPESDVRITALRALQKITGLELPSDKDRWLDLLDA